MKSALVTGANKGIGLEVATLLAQRGFFVYLGSRNLASGEAAVEQLRAAGLPNLAAVQLDVTSPASIGAARAAIGAQTPVLDVLVNTQPAKPLVLNGKFAKFLFIQHWVKM